MANDVGSVLGKKVDYKFTYDPSVLAREPRVRNRQIYGFDNEHTPFKVGFDSWHAYECSFMINNGLPVNGVMKLVVPSTSEFIVESKSLKLYLFSFNMQRLGDSIKDAIKMFKQVVTTDLTNLLGVPVDLQFFTAKDWYAEHHVFDPLLANATDLSTYVDVEKVSFDKFNETPELLQEGESKDFFIYSDLLRSNCKITHQPDWGTLFIQYKGKTGVDLKSLAQYIVSFRGENHFHEEIVECCYARLWEKFTPKELMVSALYTRRGGIDICPARASAQKLLPQDLINPDILTLRDYRQ